MDERLVVDACCDTGGEEGCIYIMMKRDGTLMAFWVLTGIGIERHSVRVGYIHRAGRLFRHDMVACHDSNVDILKFTFFVRFD